ncbi:MAG: chemotaxis protein CheB [bacterium]
MTFEAIVVGVSAGGWQALHRILPGLPATFPTPMMIVQHMAPSSDDYLARSLNNISVLTVKEADEKEIIRQGYIYTAPANYHLLVEQNRTFSLSTRATVNYTRPSIDVLFETAADAYGSHLIGVVLTGASHDGSRGLLEIKKAGGLTIVQDPRTAEAPFMPQSAIDMVPVDYILPLDGIIPFLAALVSTQTLK